MGQIANISLLDGQATPVAKIFTPSRNTLDRAMWSDKSSGRFIGLPAIEITSRTPIKGSPLYKVGVQIVLPTLETITNANAQGYAAPPALAYETKFVGSFICPSRCSQQERKDIAAFASNLFKDAQFIAALVDFTMPS